jgi:hypothetical protein
MQRVTQYSLLVDKVLKRLFFKNNLLLFYFIFFKLLKHVPQNDEDYPKLLKASVEAVELIKKINDDVGRKSDLERLEWLEEHIANAKNIVVILKYLLFLLNFNNFLFKGLKFLSPTSFMGDRRLIYHGPVIKVLFFFLL